MLKAMLRWQLAVTSRHDDLTITRFMKEQTAIRSIISDFSPEVVLLHGMASMPLAAAVTSAEVPLTIYWHDAEDQLLGGTPELVKATYIANSSFTLNHYRHLFNLNGEVIAPIFKAPASLEEPRGRAHKSFLFVNPVLEKGLGLALGVAALCPEIPFEFLESWEISSDRRSTLMSALSKLPNVLLTSRQGNMRPVYERSRVLLMPSLWQEAWGKVVTEAQAFGLPVIARATGGLPESVGSGGVLMPANASAEEWAAEVRELSRDDARYEELSQKAWRRAQRTEVNPEDNLLRLREVLQRCISGHRATG